MQSQGHVPESRHHHASGQSVIETAVGSAQISNSAPRPAAKHSKSLQKTERPLTSKMFPSQVDPLVARPSSTHKTLMQQSVMS